MSGFRLEFNADLSIFVPCLGNSFRIITELTSPASHQGILQVCVGPTFRQFIVDDLQSDTHRLKGIAASQPTSRCQLFSASRGRKASTNDADRLRKYLNRFGIEWSQIS